MSAATQTAVAQLVHGSTAQAFVTVLEAVEDEARKAGVPLTYIAAGDGFRRLVAYRRTRHLQKQVAS